MPIKLTNDQFVQKAREIHNNFYTYLRTIYVSSKVPVIITCPIHGDFLQKPNSHLMGQGCPICGKIKAGPKKVEFSEFLKLARIKHGFKFEYIQESYSGLSEYVTVICPHHGLFQVKAHSHLSRKHSCISCYRVIQMTRVEEQRSDNYQTFLKRAGFIHGKDTYIYPEASRYYNALTEIEIVCKIHGSFFQTPTVHVNDRCGCLSCFTTVSKAQSDLAFFVENDLGIKIEQNYVLENGTELDIYCPEHKLGIEYNGIYWHSDEFRKSNYHKRKLDQANSENIRLVHIFEDEWLYNLEKCKSLLRILFHKEATKFDARKCSVKQIPKIEAMNFLNETHLQESGIPPTFAYGLFFEEILISVMTFHSTNYKLKKNEIELTRFASKGLVRGGFTKLLSAFIKDHKNEYASIISFSERRWSKGDVYSKNGFKYEHTTDISYWWVQGGRRIHKRFFQHQYLEKRLKTYDPKLSEVENCTANGLFRIWDCGKDKWRLTL